MDWTYNLRERYLYLLEPMVQPMPSMNSVKEEGKLCIYVKTLVHSRRLSAIVTITRKYRFHRSSLHL